MLKCKWQSLTIKTERDANDMWQLFKNTAQLAGGFDTETTGLHIKLDKPFLFQFGWCTPDLHGYTFAVDLERTPKLAHKVISIWNNQMAPQLPVYLAHNVKYDLHMLENIGLSYTSNNISDTMFYIRYAHDNLTPENGGPPMQLKAYAARYIDSSARTHERLLKSERSEMAKILNTKLKNRLKVCGSPPPEYKAKSYTLSVISEMFHDPIFTADDLPVDVRKVYYQWLNEDVPLWLQGKVTSLVEADMIPYNKLNRENVLKYAHLDIVWVLEVWLKLNEVVKARCNTKGLQCENDLIYPLLSMENVGFKADKPYLESCAVKMKAYIKRRRAEFYRCAGEKLKIGQHERIKDLIKSRFGEVVSSTDNSTLEQLHSELLRRKEKPKLVEFIECLTELRTLEKWYAVYIVRFISDLEKTDRLYTTINQVGTVSGRVTSDFQQFPKDAIKTKEGEELFQPRKMIQVTGGDYTDIIYLDFSQIELRFQALYTILVGHPDLNLCRAYMPYQCVNSKGELFDYKNPEHVSHWRDPWYYQEDPTKHWIATDVHGATTKAAFGIDESDPQYHRLRYVGKRVNFAKNYGAQYKKICQMFPERTPEECRKIDAAYYTAFPGVKKYHDYCYSRAQYAYTSNIFGIRYYGVSGHKLINMLVQGSAAYYLKYKIIEIYKYEKAHGIKTRWQMQIHDELSWERYKDDPPELFFEYQKLMQDWSDGWVPLVADMEVTDSTWANKVEVVTVDELRNYFESRPIRQLQRG